MNSILCVVLFTAILLVLARPAECWGVARIPLDRCCIVMDSGQPSYVQYGVEDLAAYLAALTRHEIPVGTEPDASAKVCIAVGQEAARRVLGQAPSATELGEHGYLLKSASKDGAQYIVAAGATPRGTKLSLAALMKLIRSEGGSAFVEGPLEVTGKPAFARRGMHFNGWPFNYPYTFRAWREEDWQRYIDILAYQGVNLFYLWPFIEIMPVPLSPEDEAYLEECRRVVEYAQRKHGMEVWIMQCTNRVAEDRCGVADPRLRPYWRPSQKDLDPGNPEQLKAILESRAALYRIINNADGVCNIDSDPGYCPGSPLSDYVKVLKGCRDLLDRHNTHGKHALLVNWMWMGWGHGSAPNETADQLQVRTIRTLKQDLPEPWALIAGNEGHLPLCKQEGVLAKTVFLPYGLIELEPAYPATNVQIDGLRAMFDRHISRYPELAGVMGNVQTPLLQFPHMFYFTSAALDGEYRNRSEKDVLLDLSGRLYPEHSELLADCYLAMKEADPDRIEPLVNRLEAIVSQGKLGEPGLFARKLFPDHGIVAQSVVMQLKFHVTQEKLLRFRNPNGDDGDLMKLMRAYCEAYLTWATAHGWHTLWGWGGIPVASDSRFPAVADKLYKALGAPAGVHTGFEQMRKALAAQYGDKAVNEGCIAQLEKAVLMAEPIESLAQKAKASASVTPDPGRYPPSAANDGNAATLYWPGALVQNNAEWLQLTWDAPQTFQTVVVRFLQHPSMPGRTIHLQREVAPGKWEDLAKAVVPNDPEAPHTTATFKLATGVTLDRIRVVNLLDLFEIEVR